MEEWETASESSEKSDLKGKNNFVGGSSKENTPKDSSLGRGGGAKKNYGSSQRGGGGDRYNDRAVIAAVATKMAVDAVDIAEVI